jgi:hypothetical protein
MKIGKDRDLLEKELAKIFVKYNLDNNVINKIKEEFISRGVSSGEFLSIIDGKIQIETIPLNMLCLLTELFYKETTEQNIKPETYFTEQEINTAKNFRRESEEQSKYPLVFENVMKIGDDHYVTYKTAQEVAGYYAKNLIVYNKQTQRNAKYSEYQDKIVEMISINKSSISDIAKDIVEGRQITNFITFNILQNGEENFEYDAKNKTLTVFEGEIDILDGFHRSMGILSAVQKEPNVKYITGINIVNWDIEKSRRFIVQEDKRNKINASHVKSLNPDRYENMIIKKLNESSSSDLKGKITTDNLFIRKHKALTTYDVINNTIQKEYKDIKTNRDASLIAEWLIEFFNELIGLYPTEFLTEIESTKETSFINNENMFAGYISLSKELQNVSNWRQKLQEVMSKIDFSVNNSKWESLKSATELNKRLLKNISNYFREIV